jgi:glycosyltransferase involved in cell wall biosynthesis
MMKSRNYTVIVPRADRTGPTNVAVDIGLAAAANGWNVTLLYLSGSPTRNDLGVFCSVRKFRFIDLFRIEGIVHSHGLRPDLAAWLFTWNPRCVVASTLHGHFPGHLAFDYSQHKANVAWWIWSRALTRFDHRICISKTMVRFYKRQFRNVSLELAYNFRADDPVEDNGISREMLEWLKQQRSAGRIVLLYAGSLSARKNVLALVEAILESEGISLLMCGEGAERHCISERVEARAPESRVLLVGHVRNIKAYLRVCDILVLPSHAEGLPLVVLEAASEGVPSLMSNLTVHRELAGLGFGDTFDRFSFHDFQGKALLLARERSPESDARRVHLWNTRFSPRQGFARYAELLTQHV